jgi:hypothetical protein
MDVKAIDHFYLAQEESIKSSLMALRSIVLSLDPEVTTVWRYGMPFFCYKGKRFCYLWVHKKLKQPYIGVVDGNKIDHPDLLTENRSRMKILLIDPGADLPVKKITDILHTAIRLIKPLV